MSCVPKYSILNPTIGCFISPIGSQFKSNLWLLRSSDGFVVGVLTVPSEVASSVIQQLGANLVFQLWGIRVNWKKKLPDLETGEPSIPHGSNRALVGLLCFVYVHS